MIQTCPRCSRPNPSEARFCYHDGNLLSNGAGPARLFDPAGQDFPVPFVFPGGASCRNFDQLARTCLNDWQTARGLLKQGLLANFLGTIGRADLATVAQEAAHFPDPDRGLDQLLRRLPTKQLPRPQLEAQPLTINLGQLGPGKDITTPLRLKNSGLGLLQGEITVEDCPWLTLGDGAGVGHKLFQFLDETILPLHVRLHHLRAGPRPQEGRLTIESNGGAVTVTVVAERPVVPFPEGVLAGATTPRDLATRAKASPREAAVLFEQGAVARWYQNNGWSYPILGPASSGLGAVQQFFEALGLVKPPPVEINERIVRMTGDPGGMTSHVLLVETAEKRPVWALARSHVPWLEIGKILLDGRRARIPLKIPRIPWRPGEQLSGMLEVTANGNQRFTVEVRLTITGEVGQGAPALAWVEPIDVVPASAPALLPDPVLVTPAPRASSKGDPASPPLLEIPDESPILPGGRGGWRRLLPLTPVAFLCLGLLIALIHDLVQPVRSVASPWEEEPLTDTTPRLALVFHDRDLDVTLGAGGVKPAGGGGLGLRPAVWEASMRFGLVMRGEPDPRNPGQPKRLTFHESGLTNNACVRIDGKEWLFGERPYRALDGGDTGSWPGRWREREVALGTAPWGTAYDGRKSVWIYEDQRIAITQTVSIVPGPQTNLLDTCLVRYRIENNDSRRHRIGLRFLLDTFIGSNDGVPFLIPGEKTLCSTSRDFRTPEAIPVYIQACEREDLTSPGTVARVQLKYLGEGMEPPARVTLGAWPNIDLRRLDPRCSQMRTLWEVPVLNIHSLPQGDSAVTIYWAEKEMRPGESREMSFAYGLGSLAGSEGGGRLALSTGGSFTPGGTITVTAYVKDPLPGQSVTLTLPEGWELLAGEATQGVPALPANGSGNTTPVTWQVRVGRSEGVFPLRVSSSTGGAQTQQVKIRARVIFGN